MKKANAGASIKKWKKAYEYVMRNDNPINYRDWSDWFYVEIKGRCGFCDEYYEECSACPLSPKHCNNDGDNSPNATFWELYNVCDRDDIDEIRRLTKTMYFAVLHYARKR